MFLFRIDLARMKWRLGCALLVLALPLVVGGWMVHDSYEQELKNDASASASKARTLLERMLDQAERANLEVLPLAGRSCSDNLLLLRKRVALEPFLRSINLVRQGIINCTSLFGPAREVDDGSRYTDRKLLLMSGNLVRKNHPLLVVRQERGRDAALSAIDSSQLSFMLTLSSDPSELFLQVGSAWLDESGHFQSDPPKLHSKFALILASQRYPFTIHAGYAMPIYWRALWEARHLQLIWLGASSLVLSLLVWWLLGRPGALTDELRRGLRAREFVPYLQPLIASKGGKMVGAEVLMRWQHATEGLIRPDLFIPQAEESGLIVPMTVNLMKTVAKTLHPVQEQLPEAFHISFNISAIHCRDLSLVAECRDFLGHFVPGRVVLVLELTERELLVTSPQTLSLFRQLDEMGVQLAIDDFGTGHSSLIYLQQFHVDYLKIDRSFITAIDKDPRQALFVETITTLSHQLGVRVVAEGVENSDELKAVLTIGVDEIQGYFYSRPLPLPEFMQFCHRYFAHSAAIQEVALG